MDVDTPDLDADSHTHTGDRSLPVPLPVAANAGSASASRSSEGRNRLGFAPALHPTDLRPNGPRGKSMAFESSPGAGSEILRSTVVVRMAELTAIGGLTIGQK